MTDVSAFAAETSFRVFLSTIEAGGQIKGFVAPRLASYTTSQVRELDEFARESGAGGLAHIRYRGSAPVSELSEEEILQSSGLRMAPEWHGRLAEAMGAGPGDMILLFAGPPSRINVWCNAMRNRVGELLELADPDELAFAFVTDFPLFEWNDDAARLGFLPPPVHLARRRRGDSPGWRRLGCDPVKGLRPGLQWVGTGQRKHSDPQPEIAEEIFAILGYSREDVGERFRQILEAFEYGAPPHGGIAPRHRPFGSHPCRDQFHSRRHSLPKDSKRYGPAL